VIKTKRARQLFPIDPSSVSTYFVVVRWYLCLVWLPTVDFPILRQGQRMIMPTLYSHYFTVLRQSFFHSLGSRCFYDSYSQSQFSIFPFSHHPKFSIRSNKSRMMITKRNRYNWRGRRRWTRKKRRRKDIGRTRGRRSGRR